MDPEVARANHILKHSSQYVTDDIFRHMVNGTVFLTPEQKESSQLEVDRVYGWSRPFDGEANG